MDRRTFTKSLTVATALAGASASTPLWAKAAGNLCGAGQLTCAAFQQQIGQQFLNRDGRPLTLQAVDAASEQHQQHQYYLRFSGAAHRQEGIYTLLDNNGRRVDLYLTPSTRQPGFLEAVINTQPPA